MASRDRPLPLAVIPEPAGAPEFDETGKAVELAGPWRVQSDGAAEWAMGKYATAVATLVQLKQQRDDWLAMVARWFEEATTPVARTAQFFAGQLEEYAIARRNASELDKRGEPTAKTLQLVTGRVTTRGTKHQIVVESEHDVIEWAKSAKWPVDQAGAELGGWLDCARHGELYLAPVHEVVVKVEESVRLKELRLLVQITENEVDCECVARGPRYSNSSNPDHDGSPDRCDVCDDTGKVIVLVPIGPEGDVVPGLAIEPPTVTATVTPLI